MTTQTASKTTEKTATTAKASKPAPAKASKPAPAKAGTPRPRRTAQPPKEMTEAEKIAAEKAKAAKEAQKEAEKLAKEAQKEAERVAKEEAKAKAREQAEKSLVSDAKEINVRFEKADKYLQQADDHRLAAALKLSEAKDKCDNTGISFKEWCETNIKQSYETARKLIPVGNAERKEEGKGAALLEDMRKAGAERMKKVRAAKAETKALPGPTGSKAPEPRKGAGERAIGAVKDMDKAERVNFLKSQAEANGLRIVTEEEAKRLPASGLTLRDMAERAFDNLPGKVKVAFTFWAAEQIGAKIEMPEASSGAASSTADDSNDDPDLPENLRR